MLSSIIFIISGLINAIIKVGKIDVVNAHQALTPAVLAYLIAKLYRIPFVITCHGSEVRLHQNFFVRIIQRVTFALADRITAVSYEIKSTLASLYHVNPSKIDVIPNGYDTELVKNYSNNSECSTFNIVYVGRLSYPKDPLTVLYAFKQIHYVIPNARLYFVGDGQLCPLLKQFCGSHKLLQYVHFLGKMPHHRALQVTAESTVFVLSSFEEGLPISLVEAMALGKPVVATKVGGVPEIVKDGVNGLLVPQGEPEQMTDALLKLLSNPKIRKEMGTTAAESVKDYSWSKIAERYKKLYSELIKKPKVMLNE